MRKKPSLSEKKILLQTYSKQTLEQRLLIYNLQLKYICICLKIDVDKILRKQEISFFIIS